MYEPLHAYTMKEYFAFDNRSSVRYEFLQGDICPLLPASLQHDAIASNTLTSLHNQLKDQSYTVVGMDVRLHVAAADVTFYPDVLVIPQPERMSRIDHRAVAEAALIVEVKSRATWKYDEESKFEFYSLLPFLQHYILVDERHFEVEHRFRVGGNWESKVFEDMKDEIELPEIGCRLKLSEIYQEIES